jgi:hypothetical protein
LGANTNIYKFTALVAISFGAAPATALAQTLSAPVEWKISDGGNGHWYQLLYVSPSESAETHFLLAHTVGGHTATITSTAENNFCFPIAQQTLGGVLIGVRKQVGNNQGAWITGEPWSYTNWHSGEGGNSWERYGEFNFTWNGEWQDTDLTPNPVSLVEFEADCNGDGIVDYGQIQRGELPDTNGNGVPDCCENGGNCNTDTDADGVPDYRDNCVNIANPTQADCDNDGIGDACELAPTPIVNAKLWGAAGGPSKCCYGGISCGNTGVAGGYVNTSLDNITPGTTLFIYVGQGGSFNGLTNTFGGGGRAGGTDGGAGGGASYISLTPNPLESQASMLLAVAGGGAGGAVGPLDTLGNGGGLIGATGTSANEGGAASTGGTQSSGGTSATGGYGGGGNAGSDGQFLQGGFGMSCAGNGGGGGLYGGGGGHGNCGDCSGGIAGGGSSFVNVAYGAMIHNNDQGIGQAVHPNASSDTDWANNAGNGTNGTGNNGRVVLIINNVRYIFNYTGSVQTFVVPSFTPEPDCNNNGIPDACEIANNTAGDCDGDGILNSCEIALGALDANLNGVPDGCEGDCNVNGQLDYLDIAAGAADCNGNLMIDSCEDGSGIYRNSGNLGNIGSGVPRSVTFDTLPAAVTSVTLEVSARANLFASNRFLIMKLNGGASIYLFQTTGTDCPSTANTYSRTFTASEFNTLTESGSLAVAFTAPGTVNATLCGSDALLQVRVAYEQTFTDCDNDGQRDFCAIASGLVKDCNRNGIPDSCDIATGFAKDCNGNGIPDICDIATGLAPDCNSNGIPDNCDPDSDGDGIIDACDPCPNVAGPCNGCPLNVCGDCGTAADSDGDGTANCIDNDDDNDGVVDSMDAFPLDANESVDTDGDGQGDNADQDDDGDGTDDATDGCPFDATKSEPGQCGCGNPDTDTDGDGIADCVDNCVAVANPLQTDCDGNGIGEACETFTDCNANGIPDSCDLASGFAQDCNGNGKPDSCDLAVSGSPYPGAVQWTVASGGNGHWYALIGPKDQSKGEFELQSTLIGVHLVSISSQEENDFAYSLLVSNSAAYIGGRRILSMSCSPDSWEWSDGSQFNYKNWNASTAEPNCNPSWIENSIGFVTDYPKSWVDVAEDNPGWKYAVIEWSTSLPTESDCNANTIPDSCDLANGGDCNNNGLLDACETFDQTTPDCNNNGVPDSCDIESRFARDCDLSGVPDSCEIAAGALDENNDGRIDLCNYAAGDFDLSNEVDSSDLSFMLLFFGEENPPFGDLDGSGVCDSADLSFCLLNFGPLE